MNGGDRLRDRLINRRVGVAFAILAPFPIIVTVFSFVDPITLPRPMVDAFELLFRYLVYPPVELTIHVLYEPFGIDRVLAIPVIGELGIVLTVLGWYYILAAVSVTATVVTREKLAN